MEDADFQDAQRFGAKGAENRLVDWKIVGPFMAARDGGPQLVQPIRNDPRRRYIRSKTGPLNHTLILGPESGLIAQGIDARLCRRRRRSGCCTHRTLSMKNTRGVIPDEPTKRRKE